MTKTVVVLGAGLAGVPLAHHLLSSTLKQVPDLKVVLVSPNEDFYWNIASIRAVVPGVLDPETLFHSIPALFAKYPQNNFDFILGKATALDPDSNRVTITLNPPETPKQDDDSRTNATTRTLEYHTLFIATGSSARGGDSQPPWKNTSTSAQTRTAISSLRASIASASSIVIGGAGPTGVELAGELGAAFARRREKSVTLVASGALPLEERIMASTREGARRELERLGVEVVTNSKVSVVSSSSSTRNDGEEGKTTLELADEVNGTTRTLTTDLYIPTHGLTFNTAFAPPSWLSTTSPTTTNRIHVDPATLHPPSHPNVFVLGDASDAQVAQAAKLEDQLRHLFKQLVPYFTSSSTPTVAEYKRDDAIVYGVAVGPGTGVGQMGGWRPPNLMIWWFKSRRLGMDVAGAYARGLRGVTGGW